MKTTLFLILFAGMLTSVSSQTTIMGRITDKSGETIVGANVYLENSYDGTSTDVEGNFSFTTGLSGQQKLVVSFIGYVQFEQFLDFTGETVTLSIILQPDNRELGGVEITAGIFEASDEKKAVILRPLDIVTTAGGLADISAVMNTLPGTQTVGEEGKLFVRGGDSYETQTFIDGMQVVNAYSSSMPDVPSRGRFSPYMFNGTMFSTGGFSAKYGQALSSALILKSNDLPEQTVTGLSLMTIGPGVEHTQKWDRSSVSASLEYMNLAPYFKLIPQEFDWEKAPEGMGSMMTFRHQTNADGMLKGFATFNHSNERMNYPSLSDIDQVMALGLKNNNLYTQVNYQDGIGSKIISQTGASFMQNTDDTDIDQDNLNEKEQSIQVRQVIKYIYSEKIIVEGGAEWQRKEFRQKYFSAEESTLYQTEFTDNLFSGFAEAEVNCSHRFALRAGGRVEYSGLLRMFNMAPRVSVAYRTGKSSQVSLAYGIFYQSPDRDYLLFDHDLDFERAAHYILNYQIMKNRRIFRVEVYRKKYDNLIKYNVLNSPDPSNYNNNGSGYAQGIDIFWRDQRTFSNIDYWISYSFLDTERDYKDYPVSAVPTFASRHNASVVVKYWVGKLSTQFGGTYSFSSGRTYYNPNSDAFLNDQTKPYHDLSLNASYLTEIFKKFTIVHLSVSNVLGFNNVFGYHYQTTPNPDGSYPSFPIKQWAKRFWFLGVFVSI
ncbi:MAG TPA: TonB-dependent receptor [Bacteroidales bacterium]|nr:TonB-dependent receptor [Bacteroidales bacterium]HNS45761.1 TonB-dependent receptor [Bacteroidales bacterium]